MLNMNLSSLVAALDEICREALEDAAGACVARGGHEITIEDYFEKLLPSRPMQDILTQFDLSADKIREQLEKRRKNEGKSSGRPVFSPLLVEFLQEAYLLAGLEFKQEKIDVFTLVLALIMNPVRYAVMPFFSELGKVPADSLRKLMEGLAGGQSSPSASGGAPGTGESAIKRFTIDFTEEARAGKTDPVFARGQEIRQMIDILTRRRKNNPILVGDPGVGKTAVVEGLAMQVVQNMVPDALKGVRIIGLDMGRLQAGASVKGEFEKRLKGVIDEVKASPVPIVLFIDEAHTLVGSGNASGSGDGANLLKPALARGEMRTIAATTWSEYKKYFEKDAALARRFQLVKLDEPNLEETVTILRGIVPYYEKNHKVYVRDDAVVKAAELSSRYISGRYQPDKAIDVLDTACARVHVSLGAKPRSLEVLEDDYATTRRTIEALERDRAKGVLPESNDDSTARHAALIARAGDLQEEMAELNKRWEQEKKLVAEIIALRTGEAPKLAETEMTGAENEPEQGATDKEQSAENAEQLEQAAEAPAPLSGKSVAELTVELKALQGKEPLVFYEVNPTLVASIVSDWTGVPMNKLISLGEEDESTLSERLRRRIKGQDYALQAIEKAVLASQTGLNNPNQPTATFLLVGPSGVGKTETAIAVADELFGGEEMLISINMSEFQEKHTISRLIGSPPGYVGYGEGGRLTEAVRRQPYSPVLFDEVEKAHPDVINLFYQVFDKGVLADGEGREINFKNTMIFLTSNLGSDIITAMCEDGPPDPAQLQEALRPVLSQFFRPALLGRMTIVPYATIGQEVLKELIGIKLGQVKKRLYARHRISLDWSGEVVDSIAASCTSVDTGARNIDHIVNATLLPEISSRLLGRMSTDNPATAITIGLDAEKGVFTYSIG